MATMVRERRNHAYTQLLEITPALRQRIERTIESLIVLLDSVDGDPDLEASIDAAWMRGTMLVDLEPDFASTVEEDILGLHRDVAELEVDDDFEDADDNGIADLGGLHEQAPSAWREGVL